MSVMDAAAAGELVKEMRRAFSSGRTRPRRWREEQLRNIIRMTEERESDILAALAKDVGKPQTEAFTSDVSPPRCNIITDLAGSKYEPALRVLLFGARR